MERGAGPSVVPLYVASADDAANTTGPNTAAGQYVSDVATGGALSDGALSDIAADIDDGHGTGRLRAAGIRARAGPSRGRCLAATAYFAGLAGLDATAS
jgi:hypothetical protein